MKYTFILLSLLLDAYATLSLLNLARLVRLSPEKQGLYSLAFFFFCTGAMHFHFAGPMSHMLPPWVPQRMEIIYVTGVLEMLGAIGLLVPHTRRLAGWCFILLLIGVFPTNVYAAVQRLDIVGQGAGPILLWVRAPLQFLLIGWTYFFSVFTPLNPT